MIAALALAAVPMWVPVGETASRLRLFVDRASVVEAGGLRRARVRLGSPAAITGRIVLVYQDEEFDCAGKRWRMLAFEARDEDDGLVERSAPADPPFLRTIDHSIGDAVARTVCGFDVARPPARPPPAQPPLPPSSSASASAR